MASTLIFMTVKPENRSRKVEGDSPFKGFEGQIEVQDFKWSFEATGEIKQPGNNKAAPRLNYGKVKLTKGLDTASTGLMACMKAAERLSTVTLTVGHRAHDLQTGAGQARKALTVVLENCLLDNINLDVSESGSAVFIKESIELSFQKIQIEFYPLAEGTTTRTAPPTFSGSLDSAT